MVSEIMSDNLMEHQRWLEIVSLLLESLQTDSSDKEYVKTFHRPIIEHLEKRELQDAER